MVIKYWSSIITIVWLSILNWWLVINYPLLVIILVVHIAIITATFFHRPAGHGFLGALCRCAAAAAPGATPRGEGGAFPGRREKQLWEDLGIGTSRTLIGRSRDMWGRSVGTCGIRGYLQEYWNSYWWNKGKNIWGIRRDDTNKSCNRCC